MVGVLGCGGQLIFVWRGGVLSSRGGGQIPGTPSNSSTASMLSLFLVSHTNCEFNKQDTVRRQNSTSAEEDPRFQRLFPNLS